MKIGDRVKINDYSEAQGDEGVVYYIQANGIILVELDGEGTLWPIWREKELTVIE